ncbi:beta-lactamase/transpeptidase-like protein [Rickenella mellea]|uniref:Beta-lactamase/transpeptidase-like protein n=1 Tax=Rickenella mellea TaxID=50990 RepID=A0A4R5XG12_9AGAM|nr:beta-lactamase/transpeptidase-like protein [Rickenella mellea]
MLFGNLIAQFSSFLSLRLGTQQVPLGVTDPAGYNALGSVIDAQFSSYVEHVLDKEEIKGISLAVVKPGGDTEYGAWGIRTEDGEKMTSDTLFNIASCSKAFLASSVGILIDDYASGKNITPLPAGLSRLDWDYKVEDILPGEWILQDTWATEKANLRDILSHVSGLPGHDGSYGPGDSPKDVVRRLRYLTPAFELREHWLYNNQMYMIGAHIISTYTGSYVKYVKHKIFDALKMNSTTFSAREAERTGKLTQSWTAHSQRIPYWMPDDVMELNAGPGGIITNTVDLIKWLKMLLKSGVDPVTSNSVIPRSAFEAVTTAYAIMNGKGPTPEISINGYGMGWWRYSYQGHEVVAHSGGIPGFSSFVTFLPNDDVGVAVLINTGDKGFVARNLAFKVFEKVLQLPAGTEAKDPSKGKPDLPPRHQNSSTPLPLESYGGTYGDAGYGSFTLCPPNGTSFYCQQVLADFKLVDNAHSDPPAPPQSIPQLFGAWERMWGSHIRLVHHEENIFNISLTSLFPNGYGADKTPFETSEQDQYVGHVEFVVEEGKVDGLALFDTVPRKRRLGSVKERADAWFRKV